MSHPGSFDPNMAPQQWRPGMGPRPQFDARTAPRSMGTGPPPSNTANDPAYPPMPGYENVSFRQPVLFAPPPLPPPQGKPPPMTFTDLANLDEEACRAAMMQHVSEHCCYGSKPAKEMNITKTTGATALHYTLETFSEGRTTKTKRVPYKGGPVDGPENGSPPPPWNISCQPTQMFQSHVIKIEVPHTSVIVPCGHCNQQGWVRCWKCHGRGRNRCGHCRGRGMIPVPVPQADGGPPPEVIIPDDDIPPEEFGDEMPPPEEMPPDDEPPPLVVATEEPPPFEMPPEEPPPFEMPPEEPPPEEMPPEEPPPVEMPPEEPPPDDLHGHGRGNPHDADNPYGNPHADGEYGDPHGEPVERPGSKGSRGGGGRGNPHTEENPTGNPHGDGAYGDPHGDGEPFERQRSSGSRGGSGGSGRGGRGNPHTEENPTGNPHVDGGSGDPHGDYAEPTERPGSGGSGGGGHGGGGRGNPHTENNPYGNPHADGQSGDPHGDSGVSFEKPSSGGSGGGGGRGGRGNPHTEDNPTGNPHEDGEGGDPHSDGQAVPSAVPSQRKNGKGPTVAKQRKDVFAAQVNMQPCFSCHGSGWQSCNTCGGDGRITCKECDGYRMLRCFIELKVAFTNHNEDHIIEGTDMPDELVRTVGGTVIFQDTQPQVWPITSYPVPEINYNSQRLVASHRGKWPSERMLQQRQTLRGVPVTEVAYTWDDVSTRFWVYGNERKVYAPDYPHQCCCGCCCCCTVL